MTGRRERSARIVGSRQARTPVEVTHCCPEQAVGWEADGELAVVLRPRFMSGPLAWWLQPRLSRPYFRVRGGIHTRVVVSHP